MYKIVYQDHGEYEVYAATYEVMLSVAQALCSKYGGPVLAYYLVNGVYQLYVTVEGE